VQNTSQVSAALREMAALLEFSKAPKFKVKAYRRAVEVVDTVGDSVLEGFDVVIASIHARHRMDRAAMTARLVRAMSLPIFKIWGHGLGRILNLRDAIDCDVPAVLDALAGSRGAIELNSDPQRLDLPPEWIPAARERKIPFVISVDAHSTRGLTVLRYGTLMARRGGLLRAEVLNTESAERFAALVRPTQAG